MKKYFKKVGLLFGVVSAISLAMYCQASAAMDGELSNTMTTSFTAVKDDSLGALKIIAPIAVTIFGSFLAWRYGKKFFTGISK